MSPIVVGLRTLAFALRVVGRAPLVVAWLCTQSARPFLWGSRACLGCAREWELRLWERGQHTDLGAHERGEPR